MVDQGGGVVALGGMHGCSWGCMVALGGCVVAPGDMHGCSGGHAWLLWGACVVALGGGACMVAPGGHAWLLWGTCVVAPGGGHVWDTMRYGDTINERAVLILLECILVIVKIHFALPFASRVLLTYVQYRSGATSCQNLGSGTYKLPATVPLIIISWCLCQLDVL